MKIFLASTTPYDTKNIVFMNLKAYLSKSHDVFYYSHDSQSGKAVYSFDKLIVEIAKADVFVAEMSGASQTLGFQLAHALQLSKPVLYLYSPEEKGRPQGLIGNIPSRGLKIKKYDADSYKKVVDEFLEFADKQMFTTRTSFISTREIDEFISLESKRLGTSKGEVLRQLLHKAINS